MFVQLAATAVIVVSPFAATAPLLVGGVDPAPLIVLASQERPAQPLQEDDPGWDCAASGDRVCGPLGDDWGHAPGCYSDAGALVAVWPCHVVVDPVTGEGDVYEGYDPALPIAARR